MRWNLVVVTALALSACASANQAGMSANGSTAQSFPTGDGRTAWEIHCDGAIVSIAVCYNRAAALCPGGFDPLSQDQHANGGSIIGNPWGGATVIQGISRAIMVTCKAPAKSNMDKAGNT